MNFRVTDPDQCTVYDRARPQLEEFLTFCIAVAGKNARTTRGVMERFWRVAVDEFGCCGSPFEILKHLSGGFYIPGMLQNAGLGCHSLKGKSMLAAAESGLDLKKCSLEELETIKGIGRKTSRFFVLHSRRGARCAVLDTHILKFLRDSGRDAPASTPSSGARYRELEAAFLDLVPAGKTVAEFDLEVWKKYSKAK